VSIASAKLLHVYPCTIVVRGVKLGKTAAPGEMPRPPAPSRLRQRGYIRSRRNCRHRTGLPDRPPDRPEGEPLEFANTTGRSR
jgi:hypothetical protein